MNNYNSKENILSRITGNSNYSVDDSLKRILGKNYDSYNKTRKKTTKITEMKESKNYYSENTMNNTTTEKADGGFFNKNNAFSDGYQFGDVTKTLFATVDDVGTNLVKGAQTISEGALDLLSYGTANALDFMGKEETANKVKDFAKKNLVEEYNLDDMTWTNANLITGLANRVMGLKDLYSGEAKTLKDYYNATFGLSDSYNEFIHDTKEKNSLAGDKTDAVAQGLGYYGGMVALQSVGVPWQVTAGVTSLGSGLSEAYNEGASDKDAWIYAGVSSIAEIGSEYLFSGLGKLKGTGALDDAVAGNLTKSIKNSILKNVAQYGIKSAGEGVEEIASGMASNIAKRLTYMKDDEKTALQNAFDGGKDYLQSDAWNDFVTGTLVSAISGGNEVIKANKSGRNYMTGLTTNESKVVDSEVQTRLETELNKPGNKNLTTKQKNSLETKIREQVTSDLQQGKIDINKVNEIVGEENVKYDGNKKDTYLINSKINEQQKSRSFEYVKTENVKVDNMLQSLTNAGANNTIQTHDMARLGTKLINDLGIEVEFISNNSIDSIESLSPERKAEIKKLISEGKTVNGFKDNGKLYLNLNSIEAGSFVFGHETLHFFENDTETYNTLKDTLINLAKTKGTYDTDIADLERLYKDVEGANVESELIANYIGQNFTNQEFVNSLTTNPSTFTKIYNYIKEMFYKATGQTEKAQLQKIKNTFDKAYRNYAKNNNVEEGTKLSVSDIKNDMTSYERKLMYQQITDYLDKNIEEINEHINNDGEYETDITLDENEGQNVTVKFKDDGEGISYDIVGYKNQKKRSNTLKDNKTKLNNLSNIIKQNSYVKEVNVDSSSQTDSQYLNIKLKNGEDITVRISDHKRPAVVDNMAAYEWNYDIEHISKDMNIDTIDLLNEIGKKISEKSKTQYSISDNQGRELTKEQQEYFKDSKARDENGNLINVFHTMTSSGTQFNEFNPVGTRGYKFDDQVVNYYTNSKEMSGSYADQDYIMADTKKINSVEEANEWLKSKNDSITGNELKHKTFKLETIDNRLALTKYEGQYRTGEHYYKSKEDALKKFQTDYAALSGLEAPNKYQYSGYVNITKPYVIDAEGRYWNKVESKEDSVKTQKLIYLPEEFKKASVEAAKDSIKTYNENLFNWQQADNTVRDFATDRDNTTLEQRLLNRAINDIGFDRFNKFLNNEQISWGDKISIMDTLSNEDLITTKEKETFDKTDVISDKIIDRLNKKVDEEVKYESRYLKRELEALGMPPDIKTTTLRKLWSERQNAYDTYDKGGRYEYSKYNDFIRENESLMYQYDLDATDLFETSKNDFTDEYIRNRYNDWSVTNDIVKQIINLNKYGENYDGVIIKNVVDYGGVSKTHESADLYITFESNQFKNIDNTKPTNDPDIRYSISDNESKQSALFPTLDNTKLSDSIKTEENIPVAETEKINLPGNEVITEEPKKEEVINKHTMVDNTINKQSIKGQEITAKEMRKYMGLNGDERIQFINEIEPYTKMTQEELLQDGNYDKIKDIINKHSTIEMKYIYEDAKAVKNKIRKTKIKITDNIKNDISDYNYFRKSNFGKLRLSNEGTYIDVLWNELSANYPHYFSDEILAESDMLYALSDFMNEDNSITDTEFLSDNQIDELTNNVFGELLENSITNEQLETLKQKDIELSNQKQNEINEVVKSYTGTQEEYLSTKAQELYDEISNLKKGVKASKELGALLDTGAKWSDIKAALSNVKWKPGQVVDKNFEIENVIRQELTNMYDNEVKEFTFNENNISDPNNMTTEEIVKMKRYNYLKSLNNIKNDMNTTLESINDRIESKQAEYDGKKDNTTLAAQNLLKQISDLTLRKSNIELEYNNRINKLEEKIKNYDVKEETRKVNRQEAIKRDTDFAEEMLGDLSQYKDKKRGISYKVNTQKRNLYDITSKENAKKLYDAFFRPITEGSAESERIKTKYKQQFADMKITPEESTYIQMLGELRNNPDTTLTKEIVETYYKANEKKIDANKVDNAIELARQNYDELFALDNEVRERNGYKPIEYRKGYFPHFIEEKAQSKIGKLAEKFGWNIKSGQIPASIAGITDIFRPGKIYSPFDKHRTGDTTDYNFLKGFDMYVDYVADNVTQMDNIQKLRALETTIRKQYSEEGIKKKIEEILADENIDNESKYDSIDALVKNAQDNPLSNWVTDLRNYTDNLANKKAFMDRTMEQSFGRQTYSIMNNVMGRVSANMVGGNIASALTNFIPITQGFSQFSVKNGMKATMDFIKSCINDDGLANKSTLLTNRTRQAEKLSQTTLDKVSSVMTKPFEFIDEITSNILVRAKMYENLDNGMTETEALKNADEFAKDVMGGRAKGDAPTIMNVKNPFVKVFTAFQLEVNNQYGYMFKDIPRDIGDEAKEKLVGAFFKMFLAAFLYNKLDEKITGRKSAFSPVDIAIDEMKVATNENLSLGEKISTVGTDVAQQLPFVGGVMGGGRLPIQGAIPFNNPLEMVTKTLEEGTKLFDSDPKKKEKAFNELKKEWSKPIFYLGLPFGGGQLKKTIEGTSMYNDNLPIKGSYTTSNQLRFEADDSPLGRLQAAVFGQYANENAREYFDKGYKPLTEKQIEEVMESELGVSEYREIKEGLKKQSNNEEKIDYIYNLPLADNQKNVLANNILNRKEEVDISNYGEYGSLEEFDYANKNPKKYSTITQITDYNTYNQYKDEIANIKKEYTDTDERKNAVFDYINSLEMNKYQKAMLYNMAGGYSIKSYANEMFDYIDSLEITAKEKQVIYDELFK